MCVCEWLQLLLAIQAASSFSASFPPLMKIQRQRSYWHRAGEERRGGDWWGRNDRGGQKGRVRREEREKWHSEGAEGGDGGREKRKCEDVGRGKYGRIPRRSRRRKENEERRREGKEGVRMDGQERTATTEKGREKGDGFWDKDD